MASGKQYKNVYTILEKVKKGEIQSYYKDNDGLFGKINFYKKADLIKPYMHYIDEGKLETIVDAGVLDHSKVKDAYNRLIGMTAVKALPDDQKPDMNKFFDKLKENYKKMPKHIAKDIHKMYYHKMDKLEFEERTDKNYTKFKMLEKSNNPVAKIMTETSNLKSSIFARNLMQYYLLRTTMMEYIDKDAAQQFMQGMSGDSEFDQDGMDQTLDKMFNDRSAKSMLDEAIRDATDTCKAMDDAIDKDTQEQMFDQINQNGGNQAGNLSPDFIRKVVQELSQVSFAMGSLKEKIKKLLDKSVSYFSAQTVTKYEDLFSSDNIGGLQDYLELHPKLRKICIEDILIKDEKRVGKIDVYVDISGSMSSNCGSRDVNGNHISKLNFAKAFIVKLKEMNMLNDVYLFNNSVKKYKSDPVSIAMLDTSGGTDIEKAVQKIEQNGLNALVITDAEDHCDIYSDKAFFIGVEGSNFSSFRGSIEQYSDRGQVVVFNGSTILNVDRRGKAVTK